MATATAPVWTARQVEVRAGPEVVWDVLVGFERWPEWNDDVDWVHLAGPVAPGATFRWKSGPGTISATVVLMEPPSHLVLAGTTLRIRAAHDWRIEPLPTGGTLVRTEESWSGLLARVLRGPLQARLDRRIDGRLRHLAAEAERRAASG
jgi:hypothetical protein